MCSSDLLYIAYMMFTGQEVSVDNIQKELQKASGKITEKVGEVTGSAVNETLKKAMDKK